MTAEQIAKQIAAEGLDVRGYHGKWVTAQRLAKANERTDYKHLLPYWERVRLLFLELGGCYLSQRKSRAKK